MAYKSNVEVTCEVLAERERKPVITIPWDSAGVKYQWHWVISSRDNLSIMLEGQEDKGWEIFSIVSMDAPSNFLMIVGRKPR